jgi:hypothetical protein
MDKEKAALLEHAARCRRTADQIDRHPKLRAMAAEYESRAARLEDQTTYFKKSDENLRTVSVEDIDHGLGLRGFGFAGLFARLIWVSACLARRARSGQLGRLGLPLSGLHHRAALPAGLTNEQEFETGQTVRVHVSRLIAACS